MRNCCYWESVQPSWKYYLQGRHFCVVALATCGKRLPLGVLFFVEIAKKWATLICFTHCLRENRTSSFKSITRLLIIFAIGVIFIIVFNNQYIALFLLCMSIQFAVLLNGSGKYLIGIGKAKLRV